MIDPICPLVINQPAFAAQQHMQAPIEVAFDQTPALFRRQFNNRDRQFLECLGPKKLAGQFLSDLVVILTPRPDELLLAPLHAVEPLN
jgi:hypothetical protein